MDNLVKKSKEPILLGGDSNSGNGDDGEKSSSIQKLIAVFVVGVIIGGGSVWMWLGKSADTDGVSKADKERISESGETANVLSSGGIISDETGNAILVQNQARGNSVSIDTVVLSQIGWVAIHEDRDGEPGNILGAKLFDVGRNSGTVELLRPTVEGGIYYAMLHDEADIGNNGFAFDYQVDLPILDSSGKPIMKKFSIISNQPAELR
jgi:hypothetical protein